MAPSSEARSAGLANNTALGPGVDMADGKQVANSEQIECQCCMDDFGIDSMVYCNGETAHVSTPIDASSTWGFADRHSSSAQTARVAMLKCKSVFRSMFFIACPMTSATAALQKVSEDCSSIITWSGL
jgi:hypothetical protein